VAIWLNTSKIVVALREVLCSEYFCSKFFAQAAWLCTCNTTHFFNFNFVETEEKKMAYTTTGEK
jgi:hypothetical protein